MTPGYAEELLRLDEARALSALERFVRGFRERCDAGGVLIGLSGGLDSAVLAAVCARAVGAASVRALYLYDRDHPPRPDSDAALAAGWLGIELEAISIEPGGVRGSRRGPALLDLSPSVNRILYRAYGLATGEPPFDSSLIDGSGAADGGGLRDRARRLIGRWAGELFDERHRRRRAILESKAAATGTFPLGGANRSEWETGWFVSGGIDDLPQQPLIGLYKTQIRQIARCLGVPEKILRKRPSPDMLRGIDDEFALGMSYDSLDVALDVLDGGTSAGAAAAAGVTRERIDRAARLKELSRWKRRGAMERFPADGGKDGGLRAGRDASCIARAP